MVTVVSGRRKSQILTMASGPIAKMRTVVALPIFSSLIMCNIFNYFVLLFPFSLYYFLYKLLLANLLGGNSFLLFYGSLNV